MKFQTRHFSRVLLLVPFVVIGFAPKFSWAEASMASQVKRIFENSCYRCHGQAGEVAQGNFGFILDFKKLRASPLLDFVKPEKSKIYDYVDSGFMPAEGDALTKNEVSTILDWIRAGAPDADSTQSPARALISDADVISTISADLARLSGPSKQFARYFTLTALYNAGDSDQKLELNRQALSKTLNSLSWSPSIVLPLSVDTARTVFRVDISQLGWNAQKWETLLKIYPYGIDYSTSDARAVSSATNTTLPFIRADWFIDFATVPPLYHSLLDLPATERELEKMLGIDVISNISKSRVIRSGFRGGAFPDGSGVSNNNRMIERHDTRYGAYWRSYDFATNIGLQDLFTHPLGPVGTPGGAPFAFSQSGGEIIFNLPNGAQGYFLVDATGKRLDLAPSEIVQDPTRRDKRVVNGISCMNCHSSGIRAKPDQISAFTRSNPGFFGTSASSRILGLYGQADALTQGFSADENRFLNAMQAAGLVLDPHGNNVDPIRILADRFEEPITLAQAAAELGMTSDDLRDRMQGFGDLSDLLVQLLSSGVPRDRFIEAFGRLVTDLLPSASLHQSVDPLHSVPLSPNAALLQAARSGDLILLEEAISRGAKLASRDESGRTALHLASEGGFLSLVADLLIDPRTPVNFTDSLDYRSALELAVIRGHEEVVVALLGDLRTNLIHQDAHGYTAAILACQAQSPAILRDLSGTAHFGAILNLADHENGWTPLHWAVDSGTPEMVELLLLQKSIDLNAKDTTNAARTPLRLARERAVIQPADARNAIVASLVRAGARE